jgi:serine phosphatase RsbU (regulator of sigma subunit)
VAEIVVAVAKVPRYASRESGDTVEVVERPCGGLSVVIADAQGSGAAARLLSNLIVSRAVALVKDGVRDTAMHEAVHDYLYSYKGGRVSCTLTTLTVDIRSKTCTVTRNSPPPAYLMDGGEVLAVDDRSAPLGILSGLSPQQISVSLHPGLWLLGVTDGIGMAGARAGLRRDAGTSFGLQALETPEPARVAECLLAEAVRLDQGRPADDMTVAAVAILEEERETDVRRMHVRVPLRRELY